MYTSLTNMEVKQLLSLVAEKRQLYNQMIVDNKEFAEVKELFIEIKILAESINKAEIKEREKP